jgi:exodeoxyribonuclease VII large subunit
MNAKEIRAVGVGELLARLEHLKSVLNADGLFAASRKRALPFLPKVVGLICGRNSDAEKDVIENARRRWPAVQFEIREVAVQGAAAVIEVTQALKELEANVDVDVIIITRGGGSFEDLLPFSDEGLVRLVAECSTPIVSAIGHEKDAPLLDLVADFRASTPTDAGKAVVPDMDEELEKISALRARAHRNITHWIERELQGLAHVRSRPIFADPQVMITSRAERVAHDRDRAARAFGAALSLAREEISSLASQVRTLSPQATLDRGYAVVQLQDGSVVRDGAHVQPGDHLAIRVARGVIAATADAALVSE